MTNSIVGNSAAVDILVVESDTDFSDRLRSLFESAGFTAVVDTGHGDLLDLVDTHDPRCLVISHELPSGSGIDLLKSIRAKGADTATIIVSDNGEVEHAVAAIRAGAVDFIEKPFTEARLLQAVRNACKTSYD